MISCYQARQPQLDNVLVKFISLLSHGLTTFFSQIESSLNQSYTCVHVPLNQSQRDSSRLRIQPRRVSLRLQFKHGQCSRRECDLYAHEASMHRIIYNNINMYITKTLPCGLDINNEIYRNSYPTVSLFMPRTRCWGIPQFRFRSSHMFWFFCQRINLLYVIRTSFLLYSNSFTSSALVSRDVNYDPTATRSRSAGKQPS